MIDWAWLSHHVPALLDRTGQHLYLAGIAIVVGLVHLLRARLSASRGLRLYVPSRGRGSCTRSPALALFAALVPIVGLNMLTAEVPLVLYTLVILFRNVVAGFDAVPPEVRRPRMP